MSATSDAQREYLKNKANPVLEDLIINLTITMPNDPAAFIIDRLQKGESGSKLTEDERSELNYLRKEVERLRSNVPENIKYDHVESDDQASTDDDEDDTVDELAIEEARKKKNEKGPRSSVSAEVYGQFNKKEDYTAVVIEKSEDAKAKIKSRLETAFMFQALDEKEKDIVVDAMGEKDFTEGDWVIRQGDDGGDLYVVETGRLSCWKSFSKGEIPTFLKDYHPGDAFGELALLYNAPRAASIKCEEDAHLYVLDRQTFNHIVKDAAARKRERYEEFLTGVEILGTIDTYERSQISDALKSEAFKAGDTIIKQGDDGNVFYIIEEGTAIATKSLKEGEEPQRVMDYTAGDYFGELALLKNEPRAANVIAETDIKVATMDRYSFKRMLGPLESLLKRNMAKYQKYAESA